jgi:hypothetical protein
MRYERYLRNSIKRDFPGDSYPDLFINFLFFYRSPLPFGHPPLEERGERRVAHFSPFDKGDTAKPRGIKDLHEKLYGL